MWSRVREEEVKQSTFSRSRMHTEADADTEAGSEFLFNSSVVAGAIVGSFELRRGSSQFEQNYLGAPSEMRGTE